MIPKIVSVMRNRNRFTLTSDCIASIQKIDYPNSEIIIVDDNSSDGSGKLLQSENPYINVIFSKEYLEYCKGLNIGINSALENEADFVFVLNNDTINFSKNYFRRALEIFKSDNNIGLVGSKVLKIDGSLRWDGSEQGKFGFLRNTPDCGYMIKREVFEDIGLLDEDYIRFFEDLDFIVRLKNAGYETRFVEDISFIHIGEGTVSRCGETFHYLRPRAAYVFCKKHCTNKSTEWIEKNIKDVLEINQHYLNRCPNGDKKTITDAISRGLKDGRQFFFS